MLTFNLQAGHTFVPRDKLLPAAARLLSWTEEELEPHLENLRAKEKVRQDIWRGREVIYLDHVWHQEVYVSREINRLREMPLKPPPDLEKNLK